MKKLKQNCKSLATFLSLIFLFGIFQSCSQREELASQMDELDLYSGEEIFRGLFFLEGDFAAQIPTLNQQRIKTDAIMDSPAMISSMKANNLESKTEIQTQIANFRQSIINDVKNIDPTIFEDLKRSISSGDVDLLNQTIKHSAGTLNTALIQNETVFEDVKLVDLAFKKGGINPKDFDLETAEGIQQYNKKVVDFAKSENLNSKNLDDEQAGIIIVFLVVAFALVVVGAYLLLAIGGGVLFFIGGAIYVEIYADWGTGQDDVFIESRKGKADALGYKMMLAELIDYAN